MKRLIAWLCMLVLLCAACSAAMAAGPTIEITVRNFLRDEMAGKAAEAEDPWLKFVYAQGAGKLDMKLNQFDVEKDKPLAVNFLLCSGDPKVKTLDKYADDPAGYLAAVSNAVQTHDTKAKISLSITHTAGGYEAKYAPNAEKALEKAVKSAATKGKKALNNKTLLAALTDYLTPMPVKATKKAPESLDVITPLFQQFLVRNTGIAQAGFAEAAFYTFQKQKMDVSGGPEAVRLTYTRADMNALVSDAHVKLYAALCYDERAKQYTRDELGGMLEDGMNKRAIAYRHKKDKGVEGGVTVDLLKLPKTLSYVDFLGAEDGLAMILLKSAALDELTKEVAALPDYPAVAFPESGLAEGKNKGTKLIVKNKFEDMAVSLTFLKPGTQEAAAVIFVRPGEKATVRLPKGTYTLEKQGGYVWYGTEYRFGEMTATDTEEDVKIRDSSYYHTFTFGE